MSSIMKRFFKPKTEIAILMSAFASLVSSAVYAEYNPFPSPLDPNSLNGTNGFMIDYYINPEETIYLFSVSSAGDLNGDGIDDVILGDSSANNKTGQSYVIFGSKEPWPAIVNLFDLNGKNGFIIDGINPGDNSGVSVSGVGDLNGDGIDDIIIGANGANNNAGQSYVVFGSKEPWPSLLDLNTLNGKNGFILNGIHSGDKSGTSVSGVGDINGDGIDDVIIGAPDANNQTGQSYVVFGSKQAWPRSINLSDLNGSNGFVLNGLSRGDKSGIAVSSAGDFNADGIPDLIVGASYANDKAGQSYIVLGRHQQWSKSINFDDYNGTFGFNGTIGFVLNGIHSEDESGETVSGAGDINGDGVPDVIIGASMARKLVGQSYVVFGNKNQTEEEKIIDFIDLDGSNGFIINGIDQLDYSGYSVSGAGDINRDGIDDFLIGSIFGNNGKGQSYLIYGRKSWPRFINLNGLNVDIGFIIDGGQAVSSAGDINGDGIPDIIIGGNSKTPSYVIFGCCVETPSDNPNKLELVLGLVGGVVGVTIFGITGYYVYQHYNHGDYLPIQQDSTL